MLTVVNFAAFSHADVFPPQPHPLAEDSGSQRIPTNAVPVYVDPLEITLQVKLKCTSFSEYGYSCFLWHLKKCFYLTTTLATVYICECKMLQECF